RDAVDHAVAVVVAPVADLGARPDRRARAPRPRRAGLTAGGALPEVGAAGAHQRLVHPRVAVVVAAVADLGLDDAGIADAALVDRPVAVVVDPVADLGGRRAAGPARVAQALVDD